MVFKTEDCVKAERAPGLSSSQKGFMMELQDLQDALKMEIQVHQKLVAQMKQDPQNTELKKQLHELQTKITALSDKQKKVVEQLRKDLLVKQDQTDLQTQTQLASQLQPHTQAQSQAQSQSQSQAQFPLQLEVQVQAQPQLLPQPQHPIQPGSRASSLPPLHTPPSLPSPDNLSSLQSTLPGSPIPSSKSLPLLLSAIPSPRPSVAMVTTLSHTPKPGMTHHDSNSQNAPVSLQTTCPLTNQGLEAVRLVTKSTLVVHTSQPIRVPQFVPPRLAPRPACQPQVRPRPAQPVPQAPPPMLAPPQLSPRPILLTNQVTASSLPPSPTPIRQVRILNGQSCSSPAPGIIITPLATPPTHLSSSHAPSSKTVKAKTGESKSTSSKHPSPSPSPHSPSPHSPATRSTPPPRTPPRIKQEETPQKLAFMVSLGLVTYDHLEEIQSRRQERKRRTTANPVYSGAVFEPERKKNTLLYLNSPLHQPNRKRGRPPKHSSMVELSPHPPGCLPPPSPILHRPAPPLTPPLPGPGPGDADVHEDLCSMCQRSGQLLMCDTCSRVYHLDCLAPPLKTVPRGMWMCPSCQDQMLDKEDAMEWPGTLAIVHSYIAYKAAKEEEKQRQVQWAKDLRQEREQLESRVKQLNVSITRCMESKNNVLSRQRSMQTSLEKVKGLLCLIKGLKPLSPPQTTTQPPDDPTNGGTGRVSVDPMEPATEEPGDAQNNDNTKNKDIAENNNISVTVNSHNVPEINKDTVEINKDVTENKDSRSSPGEQRRPDQGATAEEEEEEEERKEEDEVEQKQEEVKLEEERSETQEAKLPINNIVNTNKMSNMNSRATEINKDGEEGEEEEEEETVEREEDVESQEREDITKLGKEEGEEEVDETKSNVRGEEEEEEKQGEMTEEETKKEAEGPKENGNESDGEEDEEEKEERMEEESVEEEEKKERLSSLSKVSDPPLTLAPPPVGVTE